jgi:transposase-like protein
MKVKPSDSNNGTHQAMSKEPDPQVVPKAKRRQFNAQYKLRILAEADNCTKRGEVGALLRREGLYSSHLTDWRKQRERGALEGLRGRKRGRKPDRQAAEIARLQRENEQLNIRLERAEKIIDVQKKLAQLLGTTPAGTLNSEML